jgi:hypothetical protein
MNKEELEKAAKESFASNFGSDFTYKGAGIYTVGFCAGYSLSEKRIAELERTLKIIKDDHEAHRNDEQYKRLKDFNVKYGKGDYERITKIDKLSSALEIAVEALEKYSRGTYPYGHSLGQSLADKALTSIKSITAPRGENKEK